MKNLRKFAIPIFLVMLIALSLALVSCKQEQACVHEYGGWLTVAPTCTENGVSTRSCTKCGASETITANALGHIGDGMICDACGEHIISLTSLFPELGDVSSLGVVIKDVYLPDEYSSQAIELAELVIFSDENGIGGYVNGEATMTDFQTGWVTTTSVYGFIEDEKLYLSTTYIYNSDVTEAACRVFPLSDILAANPEMAQAIATAEAMLPTIEAWLNESFIPCFGEINLPEDSDLPDPTEENAIKAATAILDLFFDVRATDAGYTLVLDLSIIKEANNTLNEKTVAEVIDLIGGEGKFASFEALIPTMLDYTVADLVEFVSVNLGVDITKLLASLDELAVELTGSPEATFEMLIGMEAGQDIQDILNDETVLATSVRDFLLMALEIDDAAELDAQIAEIINILKTTTPYQLMGVEQDAVDDLNAAVDEISGMLSYEITVGKDGKFASSVFSLTVEDIDLYLTITLTPEKLSVSANDGIEDSNNIEIEIIPGYQPTPNKEKEAAIKATLALAPEISEETLTRIEYIYGYTPVYEGEELVGVIILDSYYFDEGEDYDPVLYITAVEIDFRAVSASVSTGCSNKIEVSYDTSLAVYEDRSYAVNPDLIINDEEAFAIEMFYDSDDYVIEYDYTDTYGFEIYYDTASGEYVDYSGHDYEIDEEHSVIATECGQSGKYVYACTACGETNEYEYTVEHDIESATKSYTFDEENNAHVCAFICKCGEAIQVVTVHVEGDIAIAYRETANTSNDALELSFAITSAGEYTLSIDSATNDGYAHIYSGTGCIGTFHFYADEDSEFTGSFGSTNNYMSLRFYDIEAENGITISVSPA